MKTNQSQKTAPWRRTVLALACVAAMGISTVGATFSEQYEVIPQGPEASFEEVTYANSVKAPAFYGLTNKEQTALATQAVATSQAAMASQGATLSELATTSTLSTESNTTPILAVVKMKNGYGVLGANGQLIVEPTYKTVQQGPKGQRLLLISKDKTATPKAVYSTYTPKVTPVATTFPSDSYLPVKNDKTKLWGFENSAGQQVIAPQFKRVLTEFSQNRAFVKNQKGKIVAIDGSGQELFTVEADTVQPYRGGLAEIQRKTGGFNFLGAVAGIAIGLGGGGWSIGIGTGNDPFFWDDWGPWYDGSHHYVYGANLTRDGVKRGYIDLEGKIIANSKWDHVYPMQYFGTIVENDNQLGVINRKGEFVIPFGDYKYESLTLADPYIALMNTKTDLRGVYNYLDGKEVLPFLYKDISFWGHQYISAKSGDEWRVYAIAETRKEMFRLAGDIDHSYYSDNGIAWVTGDTLLGDGFKGYKMIDLTGKVIYEAKTDKVQAVSNFYGPYTAVKVSGKWGIMNDKGQWLVMPQYDDLNFVVPMGNVLWLMR